MSKNNPYTGVWRITTMESWDQDYVDEEVPGHITIRENGTGHFQFGYVSGEIDGAIENERFIFTWDGVDEMDSASGSGWLQLEGRNLAKGHIKFHQGDSSGLTAEKSDG